MTRKHQFGFLLDKRTEQKHNDTMTSRTKRFRFVLFIIGPLRKLGTEMIAFFVS